MENNHNIFNTFFKHKNSVPLDEKAWPASWKKIIIKSYEKCEKFKLSDEDTLLNTLRVSEIKLTDTLKKRTSGFNISRDLDIESVLFLLQEAVGQRDTDTRRISPSAGALYPNDVYFVSTGTASNIKPGIYHFNASKNELSLFKKVFPEETLEALTGSSQPFVLTAKHALLFTYTPKRNVEKYGWFGVRAALIEIGSMVQSISLVAAAMNIAVRAYGYADDETVDETLGIDGINEIYVLGMTIG